MTTGGREWSETDNRDMHPRLVELCRKIEEYGFRCEGAGLKNCKEWIELRSLLGTYLH